MSLIINEIFYSIQGESSFAGRPCVFIRLTGCNLRCSYCDTKYAYYKGLQLEIDEVNEKVSSYKCPLVEVTGGEPLIQEETSSLIYSLLERNFEVLLETNGSMDISKVDKRCVKIVDIKCPSSGEAEKNNFDNLSRLSERDEVKFVIGDRNDFEYAKKLLEQMAPYHPVHFSPLFGAIDMKTLAGWIMEDHLNVRLQLQLQKIIWNPEQKGV